MMLFSGGEITPLLAGRTDIERMSATCRTLQNMVVEEGGPVTRRPGTKFIASARASVLPTFESLEGVASYVGITEFAAVSDPPKKYRLLQTNRGGFIRTAAGLDPFAHYVLGRVAYNTAGSRTESLTVAQSQSYDGGGLGTNGAVGLSPTLSYENVSDDYATYEPDWATYEPTWVKDKTRKYFSDFTAASGESATFRGVGNAFFRDGGIVGASRGISLSHPTWATDHWETTLRIAGDGVTLGFSPTIECWMRMRSGNRDPGAAVTTDIRILLDDPGLTTDAVDVSTVLNIPPDTSVTFLIRRNQTGANTTKAFPERFTGDTADQDEVQPWVYFQATEGAQDAWAYAEDLDLEDTPWDALDRSSGILAGDSATAQTTSVTGGTAAESHTPIEFTGRVVRATKTFAGLTVGNTYTIDIYVRTNTIGDVDYVTTTLNETFVATAVSEARTVTVVAPVGKQRRVLQMTVDGGTTPAAEPSERESETIQWYGDALDAGGTITASTLDLLDDLHAALKATGAWSKFRYVLPLVGGDIEAALTPSLDRSRVGRPTNTGPFVDSDFSESNGLIGNGTSKQLVIPLQPAELGTSSNGGLMFWEVQGAGGGTTPTSIGINNTAVTASYDVRANTSGNRRGAWGGGANAATVAGGPNVGLFHMRRSSATSRTLFQNGASVATNTTNDAASGASDADLRVLGDNGVGSGNRFNNGTAGFVACLDGTESDAEAATIYTAIAAFMTAAGRI